MNRLRRSELSTPGSSEKMMAKAAASEADLVFLDLEDAVAPSEKEPARANVIKALNGLDWGNKTRAIRINSLETPYAYRDVIDVVEQAGNNLDVIIVPKVKAARDVYWVDRLLDQIESRTRMTRRVALEVLIEEVEAMINVEEIAHSSDRLEALIFGPGDYSASQGIDIKAVGGGDDLYPGDLWHYARNKIVIAARSAGLQMIDGPFAAFSDPEGYRRECQRSRALGAVGKWAIHPSQITLANAAYSPSQDEVDRARELVSAYTEAESSGHGAVAVNGDMVDAASVRILQKTVDTADLLDM